MERSILCAFVFLFLSICCFEWTNGIECYQCVHVDGLPDDLASLIPLDADKSCKSGKKPKKDLLKACPNDQVCAKLHADTTIVATKQDFEATVRLCTPKVEGFDNKCSENTVKSLVANPELSDEVKAALAMLKEDSVLSVCTCDSDKCNSSSMLAVTHGVWMFSLALFITKFAGLL